MEKAVGSTFAIIVGGGIVAALVVVTRIWWRKRKDLSTNTRFYRRGSSVSDEDEMSKVVAMTNSLAMIGKNMTNMVLALDQALKGTRGYSTTRFSFHYSYPTRKILLPARVVE